MIQEEGTRRATMNATTTMTLLKFMLVPFKNSIPTLTKRRR
jgi:hypothetical protein